MAESVVNGHWKGVAVTRTDQSVVHVYFEGEGDDITARFEAPNSPFGDEKGELKGSLRGDKLTLEAPGIRFRGSVASGELEQQAIFGEFTDSRSHVIIGTLTLFPGKLKPKRPLMYRTDVK